MHYLKHVCDIKERTLSIYFIFSLVVNTGGLGTAATIVSTLGQYKQTIVYIGWGLRKHMLNMYGLPTKYGPLLMLLNKACNAHFVSQLGCTGPYPCSNGDDFINYTNTIRTPLLFGF